MHTTTKRFIALSTIFWLACIVSSCRSSREVIVERPDTMLQQQLESIVRDFKGDVGLYVRHLRTGQTAAIQPDTLFPTASMVKIPILCAIFDKIEKGELIYSQKLM